MVEVQSDKSSVEISSPFTGKVVKLHYEVGQVAKVGHPLCDIEVEDGEEGETENNVAVDVEVEQNVDSFSAPQPTSEDGSMEPISTNSVTAEVFYFIIFKSSFRLF